MKLGKTGPGVYIAVWEEHALAKDAWAYSTTRAMKFVSSGDTTKKSITPGNPVELKGLRLNWGDEGVAVNINGTHHAAWVTAGGTNKQHYLHTMNPDLQFKTFTLGIP